MQVKYSKDKKVRFYEEDHKYVDEKGNRLTSVTTLIHDYVNPFDPTGIITEKYALKVGMSVKEVKEMWRIDNKKATDYGSAVHLLLENFINDGVFVESEYEWVVKEFAKIIFKGRLHTEVLVHSLLHMIAGQVDLIEDLGNKTINIWDFKTNKELAKYSKYGNKMLKHLWYLDDCNYNVYTMQLSIYGYLCELKGLKVNKLIILYINRETKKIEQHECKYRKSEVIEMFNAILGK